MKGSAWFALLAALVLELPAWATAEGDGPEGCVAEPHDAVQASATLQTATSKVTDKKGGKQLPEMPPAETKTLLISHVTEEETAKRIEEFAVDWLEGQGGKVEIHVSFYARTHVLSVSSIPVEHFEELKAALAEEFGNPEEGKPLKFEEDSGWNVASSQVSAVETKTLLVSPVREEEAAKRIEEFAVHWLEGQEVEVEIDVSFYASVHVVSVVHIPVEQFEGLKAALAKEFANPEEGMPLKFEEDSGMTAER
uniref:Uncharacterized protein n=1 Tax=Pyrodinium bahamense TaxID=73915 RepID=A0A7S0FCJ3_9DINO